MTALERTAKIPATVEGVPAVKAMIAEGRRIDITLTFSLTRYGQIIEAYLAGFDAFVERGGQLIGPCTVTTLPVATLAAFNDHGTLAGTIGVDMDVESTLEAQGVAGFHKPHQQVLAALAAKTGHLSRR